jgi:hypothetical protein
MPKGKPLMGQISVKASAILNAHAEDVYATIADYHQGHPRILPAAFFDLQVEEGGYGEGTVMRFKMKVLGAEQAFHQRVSEPEPGHVLVEQDISSVQNIISTFVVTPVENDAKAHVEISTTMNTSPGLAGIVERIVVPMVNPRLYRKELKLLEAVAQEKRVTV